MRLVRASRALVAAALCLVLLAGCGGTGGSSNGSGEPPTSNAEAGSAAAAADDVLGPDDWLLELDDDEQPGYDVYLCHVLAVSQFDAIPDDEDDYLSIVADGSTATLLSDDVVTPEGLLEVAQCVFAQEMEPGPAVELTERISEGRGGDGEQGRAGVGEVQVEWRWEGSTLGLRFSA